MDRERWAYSAGMDDGYAKAMAECRPYLQAYAQLLWYNGQLRENEMVCKLLGEPSALEHERSDLQ